MSLLTSMYKYRFDNTANSTDNLIVNEEVILAPGNIMPFPLREGLFYTNGISIVKEGTTTPLSVGTDFTFISIDPYVTAATGVQASAGIQMVDTSWSGKLFVTYQCVGGPEGMAGSLIQDLIDAINGVTASAGTVSWENIIGRPQNFTPSVHTHALSGLTELEKLAQSLDDVTNAIVNREPMEDSSTSFQEQIDRILRVQAQMRNSINSLAAVRGSTNQITELQNALDNLAAVSDTDAAATIASPEVLGSWPIATYNTVRGGVSFIAGGHSHAVEFLMTTAAGAVPKITRFADIYTNEPMFTLDAIINGNNFEVRGIPTRSGNFKTKWQYVL